MSNVFVRVEGVEKIRQAINEFPSVVAENIRQAGSQASEEILNTTGLRSYPPETAANLPPTPYYIRGRGMQYKGYNDESSERYGTKWTTQHTGYGTVIGNSASYAPRLAGEQQDPKFAKIGWRKLYDVAMQKMTRITQIYQAWIDRALRQSGL